MEYLNWMAEHWLLTIWLALIAMSTVVGAAHGFGPKGSATNHTHNYPKGPTP